MAITAATVGGLTVIQIGASTDTYADLLTFKASNPTLFDADTNLPQAVKPNVPIYLPTGVHATFDLAYLVLNPGSGIGVQTIGGSSLTIRNGVVVHNVADESDPSGVNAQRPGQFHVNGSSWDSISKNEEAPLQLRNSTLIFTTSENGSNNALVFSNSIGDGLGACRIVWDPSLTSTDDRLFIGADYDSRNTDIFGTSLRVVFNDLASDSGGTAFENVRLEGSNIRIDQQGLTIYTGLRIFGRASLDNVFDGYFGGTPVKRRACRVMRNMEPFIDAAATANSGTATFAALGKASNKLGHSNIDGAPMPFTSMYSMRVVDQDNSPFEGVKVCAFTKRMAATDYALETALNLGDRFRGYAYGDSISDTDFAGAGTNLETRFANSHSLDGEDEYVTDASGIPVISGQTAESLLEFISMYTSPNGGTSTLDYIRYSNPYSRYALYGYNMVTRYDHTLRYDTLADASVRQGQVRISEDGKITESVQATVAAYAQIDDLNKLYDYIRHLEYENWKNPFLRILTAEGTKIVFPPNSTIEIDTSQTDPVTVSYAATTTTYTLKNDVELGLPDDGNFNNLDLGSDGLINPAVDLANNVQYTDQNGIYFLVDSDHNGTVIYYEKFDSSDASQSGTADTIPDGGSVGFSVQTDNYLKITAKAPGFVPRRYALEAGATSLTIELTRDFQIDLGADISAYINDSSLTLSAPPTEDELDAVANNVYPELVDDSGTTKLYIVFGDTNLRGKPLISRKLIDDRFTTETAIEWLHKYAVDKDKLGGETYQQRQNGIFRANASFDYVRMANLPESTRSYMGLTTYDIEDGEQYDPPYINGGFVHVSDSAEQISLAADVLAGPVAKFVEKTIEAFNESEIDTSVDTLIARLTSERAAHLDGLNGLTITDNKVRANIGDDEVNIGKVKGTAVASVSDFQGSGGGGGGLTTAQAGKLDDIDTRTSDMDSRVTSARADNLDHLDADVSGISGALTSDQETKIDDIKTKTDNLNFTGDDIKATLDGEVVHLPNHTFLVWNGSDRINWWDEDSHHLERFDFDAPADVVGMTYDRIRRRVRIAVKPSGSACTIRSYTLGGERKASEEFDLPSARNPVDISIDGDMLYELDTSETVYSYALPSGTESADSVSVSTINTPRAMDTWDGFHYIVSQYQIQIRAYAVADGVENTTRRAALHTTGSTPYNQSAYGLTVDGDGIRVMDRLNGIFLYEHTANPLVATERIEFGTIAAQYMAAVPLPYAADILAATSAPDSTAGLTAADVRDELERTAGPIQSIKTKTDKLNFNSADDIKATLDSEEVTTDSTSRTASKADVSGIATQTSVNTVDAVVDAIKVKTDSLAFTSGDVHATLDGEEVVTDSASRTASMSTVPASDIMAIKAKTDQLNFDGTDVKSTLDGEVVRLPRDIFITWDDTEGYILWVDEDKFPLSELNFTSPFFVKGITFINLPHPRIVIAVQPPNTVCTFEFYGLDGKHYPDEDFDLPDGRNVIDISVNDNRIHALVNTNRIYSYFTETGAEHTLSVAVSISNPIAMATFGGAHYILSQTPSQVKVFTSGAGNELPTLRFDIDDSTTPGNNNPRGVVVVGQGIRIADRENGIFLYRNGSIVEDELIPYEVGTNHKYVAAIPLGSRSDVYQVAHSAIDTRQEIERADGPIQEIKGKTDQLNFTGDDVKATLDGETVTPGTAPPTLAQIRGDVERSGGPLQAVKTKTDKLTFNSSDEVASQAGTIDDAAIADAVWNKPTADLTTDDSVGKHVVDLSTSGAAGLTDDQAAELTAVKAKTDGLNFIGDDIKATLDGEDVTTDAASRTASKATIPTSDITAIKAKTDKLNFNSDDDIKATLDGEDVTTADAAAPTALAIRQELEGSGHYLEAVKNKTSNIEFTGTDIHATLDGELVTTDAASRTASKATIPASDITAIKTKTDQLNFTGDDVKSTLDGEAVETDAASRTASKATIPASDITAIKSKTDQLDFTGSDIKATLDGEAVETDAASRTASKADVSSLASQSSVDAFPTGDITAIKSKTDQMDFVGDDIKATLDGELVRVPHRIFLAWDGTDDKIVWIDEMGHRQARFDFDETRADVVGMAYRASRIHIAVQPPGEACTIYALRLDGTSVTSEDLTLPSTVTVADISADHHNLYVLGTDKVIGRYPIAAGTLADSVTAAATDTPLALDTWDGYHYVLSATQGLVRTFNISDGTESSSRKVTLHATGSTPLNENPYGVAVDGSGVRVMDIDTGIFSYRSGTTYVPGELIELDSVNYKYLAAIPFARSADIHAAIDDDSIISGGALTPAQAAALGNAADNALIAAKWGRSTVEVTDDEIIFRDGATVLGRFDRRANTTEADWSGGYEPQ